MLHILWILLKFILIILGILLGLVLLAVLLVLFCPVRYHAHGEKNGSGLKTLQGEAHVSWLFRALSVHVSWKDGEKRLVFTLFGISLDKLRSFLKKSGSRKKKTAKGKNEKRPVKKNDQEKKPPAKTARKEGLPKEESDVPKKAMPEKISLTEEISIPEEALEEKKTSVEEKVTRIEEKASDIEKSPAVEEKPSPRVVTLEKAYESEAKDSLFSKEKESSEAFTQPPALEEKEENSSSRKEFWSRIKGIISKIIHLPRVLWQKITSIIKGIKEKLKKIRQTIKNISGQIGWWRSFLGDERTKAALSLVWKDTKGLVHHALPTRIWGEVVFGCEDPAITGTVLAVLGMTIPFHKNKVKVTPLFEEENQLTGNVSLKGRIYGIVLVKAVLEIYLNKNIKYVIRQWKHKEE